VFRLLRLISYPHLRASWGRTALVVGGIATGVSLIVAINVINASVLASVAQTFALIAGPADLEVALGGGEIGFPESALATVRADSDVRTAVPLVRGTVSLADAPEETVQLFGAELTAEEDLKRYLVAVTDRRAASAALTDPHAILVTSSFAQRHRLHVGGTLALSTPRGVREFTVRGLLEPQGLAAAFGGQLAVMDLAAAQDYLAKDGKIDQIDVVLRDGVATVDQLPFFFHSSIRENLLFAAPQASMEDLDKAMAAAGLQPLHAQEEFAPGHKPRNLSPSLSGFFCEKPR